MLFGKVYNEDKLTKTVTNNMGEVLLAINLQYGLIFILKKIGRGVYTYKSGARDTYPQKIILGDL